MMLSRSPLAARILLQYLVVPMLLASLAAAGGVVRVAAGQVPPSAVLDRFPPPPAQPGRDAWKFVADLESPLWGDPPWGVHALPARDRRDGEAELRGGVKFVAGFPDPEGLLDTAHADLDAFLAAAGIPRDGRFMIETAQAPTPCLEAYSLEISAERCRIVAADVEGIRRGIFHVEDMMRRAGGPFLPLGTVDRRPWLKKRISRCFFGPINRPPANRDELADDEDYYPDNYLNRLAHEGINGLWLTVTLDDLCRTSLTPEAGKHRDRRLAKLRRTVAKCRRHGIGIYLFMIEPRAWDADDPVLAVHPEVAGAPVNAGRKAFCPWSAAAQNHLYEATHGIFTAVPGLAGLINICHGERDTTCQSSVPAYADARPACADCRDKRPGEIFRAVLEPMARGVHDAAPHADVIAWFYVPYEIAEPAAWVYDLPRDLPRDPSGKVVMQFNFESGITKQDLGRGRKGGDYWLSAPGPSGRFERVAAAARAVGLPVAAKIQTGCSHEVATIPFVPVPGLLHRKFAGMREQGVSHAMLCWYFGNYPGLMNKAAGELSFEPFPESEDRFLAGLAALDWGRHAPAVAEAWKLLGEAYSHYPLTIIFQYYGPMHDGVVWPLLPRPLDAPLAPSWLLASRRDQEPYAPSGDRIGECLAPGYTLPEVIEACRLVSEGWDRGVAILRKIETDPSLSRDRLLDIGLARTLGLQFRSGLSILRFYDLRERMVHESPPRQLATLREMRALVDGELERGAELLTLCDRDPRLGFHSEAEGYKYFPAKIRWRMEQLRTVRDVELPNLAREIAAGGDVFAAYAGRSPVGPTATSLFVADASARLRRSPPDVSRLPDALVWQRCEAPESASPGPRWACCHDREAIYLVFECDGKPEEKSLPAEVVWKLEPRRLWPCLSFGVSRSGQRVRFGSGPVPACDYEAAAWARDGGWGGWIRVPLAGLQLDPATHGPLRINVIGNLPGGGERAWIERHPWPPRTGLRDDNPADLGWLRFDEPRASYEK